MRYGQGLLDEILRRIPIAQGGWLIGVGFSFAFLLTVYSIDALAAEHPTYESLLNLVKSNGCMPADDDDLIIFTCEKDQTLWYFTKVGHPAHPGVIKRYVTENAQGVNVAEQGWSFAPDSEQPAFKTFLAQIRALDQQIKESFSAPKTKPTVRVYGNWQPQGTENEAVLSLTAHYFALEDGGQYDDAYTLLSPSLTAMLSLAEYKKLAEHTVSTVGPPKGRVIKTIDWEKDSPLGPPGIYAALDYSADAEKGAICGFVAWRKARDGFFTLVREETNIIPNTFSVADAAVLKSKFHCVM